MGALAVNEAGSQPLRPDWPPRLGNSAPHGSAGRVSGLAGVPGPGVSFTKVNETKGTGWGGGVGERAEAEAKEMHQSAAPPGSQLSAAPGKQAGARGTQGRGCLAPA